MPQVPGLDTGLRQPEAAQMTDSGVQARLFTGRIARGPLMGTRVLLKVDGLLHESHLCGKMTVWSASRHTSQRSILAICTRLHAALA
jgi:hypothetical protein